jgi:hypothetical protein
LRALRVISGMRRVEETGDGGESEREPRSQLLRKVKKKLKVARRGLYSTVALCTADCALAPNVVPSSPEAPPHQVAREPSTSEGRNFRRNLSRKS